MIDFAQTLAAILSSALVAVISLLQLSKGARARTRYGWADGALAREDDANRRTALKYIRLSAGSEVTASYLIPTGKIAFSLIGVFFGPLIFLWLAIDADAVFEPLDWIMSVVFPLGTMTSLGWLLALLAQRERVKRVYREGGPGLSVVPTRFSELAWVRSGKTLFFQLRLTVYLYAMPITSIIISRAELDMDNPWLFVLVLVVVVGAIMALLSSSVSLLFMVENISHHPYLSENFIPDAKSSTGVAPRSWVAEREGSKSPPKSSI